MRSNAARTTLMAVLLILLGALPARAADQAAIDTAVTDGIDWIQTQQNPATGALPDNGLTREWWTGVLASAGINSADFRTSPGDPSLQDYYQQLWAGASWNDLALNSVNLSSFSRATINAHAAGIDPSRISAERNFVADLYEYWDEPTQKLGVRNPTTGAFTEAFNPFFPLLAMQSAAVPDSIRERLEDMVRASQGTTNSLWGSVDSSGAAINSLCLQGATSADPQIAASLDAIKTRQSETSGGLGFNAANANTNTTGWVVAGMNACDIDPQSTEWTGTSGLTLVDFLLGQQLPDGSFRYMAGTATDPYAGVDALRALSGGGFVVDPPARVNPSDPRWRPAPPVSDGTPVAVALSVTDTTGNVAACKVTLPNGSPLTELLSRAQQSGRQNPCVSSFSTSDGKVASINGEAASDPQGGWTLSIDRGAPEVARNQTVGFGDVVALEMQEEALPGIYAEAAPEFDRQPVGTVGSARQVTFTAVDQAVEVKRALVTGAARNDFLVTADDCGGETIEAGESCDVWVRFAPDGAGAREASLELRLTGPENTGPVNLIGEGDSAPVGPTGATGETGSKGATGQQGPTGPEGRPGQDAAGSMILRVSSRDRVRVGGNGKALVATLHPVRGEARIKVPARLHVRIAGRRFRLPVSAPNSIASGGSGQIRIRLGKAARKRLRGRSVKVAFELRARSGGVALPRQRIKVSIWRARR